MIWKLNGRFLWIAVCGCVILGLLGSPSGFGAEGDFYYIDENAIHHFREGQKWMEVGQYDAAVREFQIAIRLKPDTVMTAAIYNNLGLSYMKVQQFPKAIVSFQQAISLNPNFSLYYENLVKAYGKSGAVPAAIRQLEQAVIHNRDDVQAWYLLGLLHHAAGDAEAAERALQTFVKLAPHSELADAAKLNLGMLQDSQTGSK